MPKLGSTNDLSAMLIMDLLSKLKEHNLSN